MIKSLLVKIKEQYATNSTLVKANLLFSLFVAMYFVSPFVNIILDLVPGVKDFSNHIISNGSYSDFEVATRVRYYFLCLIFIGIGTTSIFLFLRRFVIQNYFDSPKNEESVKLIINLSYIGIASVFAGFFLANVDVALLFIVFLGFYLCYTITQSKLYYNLDNAFWILSMITPLSIVVFTNYLSDYSGETYLSFFMIDEVKIPINPNGLLFFIFFFIFGILGNLFLKIYFKNVENEQDYKEKRNKLYLVSIPVALIVIAQSVLLEFFNVLNLRAEYVFQSPKLLFILVALAGIVISFVLYFIKKSKNSNPETNPLVKYHFPILIMSFAFMIAQPWRIYQPESEFFEFANHGISVDHFFRYGSIPLIENYDAHMLSNQLFAYLYGIINGYEPWAPFLYASYFIIINYLLAFYLFKNILGSKTTLLIIICLPILGIIANTFVMIFLVAIALNKLIKNNTKKANHYWFWIAAIATCIYRLDLGFAALIGGFLGYITINFLLSKSQEWKKFIITGAISLGSTLLLFIVLCIAKGINPIKRLKEFLIISSSNQNWTYKEIGDTSNIAFRICYYVLPVIMTLALLSVIVKCLLNKSFVKNITESKISQSALVFFVFFGLAFYFNVPRGIVRHSYFENILFIIIGTLPIAMLSLIYIKKRNNNLIIFLSALLGLYILTSLNQKTLKNIETSLFSTGLYSISFKEKFQENYAFNGTRAKTNFSLSEVNSFKNILDGLLKPDETYYDFSSANYYYALVDRKNPVYVNQSPLLLNGDESQRITIDQIKEAKVPLVLMPCATGFWKVIDGVSVDFKYYLISEYIHQNYVPLLNMTSFDIYVRKDKKNEYQSILRAKQKDLGKLMTSDFSNIKTDELVKHNTEVTIESDKSLKIKNIGEDAFVIGLINQLKGVDFLNKTSAIKIRIVVNTSVLGNIQIYYQLSKDPAFSETSSKILQLTSIGDNTLELDLPEVPKDFRLDIDVPEITIKNIEILGGTSSLNTSLPEITNYQLGYIPTVWAEKSGESVFENISDLSDITNQSTMIMFVNQIKDLKKPYYLVMEMESDVKQEAKIGVFNANNEKKSEYSFNTKIGKHLYAIRLSSNYYWWNDNISKVAFSTSKPVRISKFAMASEDGKSVENYKNTSFNLSNISDQNWYGGIGLGQQANLLLMDNSKRNLLQLNKGNYIALEDGFKIKIEKYAVVGDFIHITISENVEQHKDKLAYPNNIKIVK